MPLLPHVDPDGLFEYSVVYTDRSLNHMSKKFQGVMNDISTTLKTVYSADAAIVVPGSGTFAMEAVARQFATDKKCLIIRNGWFSFRWSQILEMGRIDASNQVLKAQPVDGETQPAYAPCPIEEVVAIINANKPDVVLAPHVETSSGITLPDNYIKSIADAVHASGGIFVLDCIASGAMWVDMQTTGVDVLISAPQKGWSGSPCCGLVMLSTRAMTLMENTQSTSFACDLNKWHQIMQAYEKGGHAYHATMPTDSLVTFRNVMLETKDFGFDKIRTQQIQLGERVRRKLVAKGYKSVAAAGFQSPCVVVSYTKDGDIQNGKKFMAHGLQIAAGVPLQCDESDAFQTFRLGLFGIEKLKDIDSTADRLEAVLNKLD